MNSRLIQGLLKHYTRRLFQGLFNDKRTKINRKDGLSCFLQGRAVTEDGYGQTKRRTEKPATLIQDLRIVYFARLSYSRSIKLQKPSPFYAHPLTNNLHSVTNLHSNHQQHPSQSSTTSIPSINNLHPNLQPSISHHRTPSPSLLPYLVILVALIKIIDHHTISYNNGGAPLMYRFISKLIVSWISLLICFPSEGVPANDNLT